jgi:hypothetical protein
MYRFHVTGEEYDYVDNKEWFDIKLMVDSRGSSDKKTAITETSYEQEIRSVCTRLGMSTKKALHFGRSVGCADLELQELHSEDTRLLGNWHPDSQEAVYSTKFPLRALRVASGFGSQKGSYWNPRTIFPVPEVIKKGIFPFVEERMEAVRQAEITEKRTMPTAMGFLQFLERLRSVIAQDVAVMMNEGRYHNLFELDVFQSEAFQTFRNEIATFLACEPNPNHQNISTVLPGVMEQFKSLNDKINLSETSQKDAILESEERICNNMDENIFALLGHFATGLQAGATSILQASGNSFNQGAFNQGEHPRSPSQPSPSQPSPGTRNRLAFMSQQLPEDSEDQGLAPPRTAADFTKHRISTKFFVSVQLTYDEWYGRESFENTPIMGGIAELESQFKKNWRSAFSSAENKRFSRMSQVITGIINRQERLGVGIVIVITELDMLLKNGEISSVNKLIERLKADGDIPNKKRKQN